MILVKVTDRDGCQLSVDVDRRGPEIQAVLKTYLDAGRQLCWDIGHPNGIIFGYESPAPPEGWKDEDADDGEAWKPGTDNNTRMHYLAMIPWEHVQGVYWQHPGGER